MQRMNETKTKNYFTPWARADVRARDLQTVNAKGDKYERKNRHLYTHAYTHKQTNNVKCTGATAAAKSLSCIQSKQVQNMFRTIQACISFWYLILPIIACVCVFGVYSSSSTKRLTGFLKVMEPLIRSNKFSTHCKMAQCMFHGKNCTKTKWNMCIL